MPQVEVVNLSLLELQEALTGYLLKKGHAQVSLVQIVSYDKVRAAIELAPGGLVVFQELRHRA